MSKVTEQISEVLSRFDEGLWRVAWEARAPGKKGHGEAKEAAEQRAMGGNRTDPGVHH